MVVDSGCSGAVELAQCAACHQHGLRYVLIPAYVLAPQQLICGTSETAQAERRGRRCQRRGRGPAAPDTGPNSNAERARSNGTGCCRQWRGLKPLKTHRVPLQRGGRPSNGAASRLALPKCPASMVHLGIVYTTTLASHCSW